MDGKKKSLAKSSKDFLFSLFFFTIYNVKHNIVSPKMNTEGQQNRVINRKNTETVNPESMMEGVVNYLFCLYLYSPQRRM